MTHILLAIAALVPAPQSYVQHGGECILLGGDDRLAAITDIRDASLPSEGYRIVIGTNGIAVTSSDAAGAYYARQTLRQLAYPRGGKTCYPCGEIEDSPAYRWRGVHFDDCRHFFGKETLKRTLDLMAQHKLNVLHWHLTEDQGWRLDVPGYPELVKYGSVRPASPVHRAKKWRANGDGDWVFETDGTRYGPYFYTEDDVREILAYAAERQITVVPEIEIPGHVYAALAAYPEYACCPANLAHRHPRLWWGIERDVLCLGNDKALKFIEDVLDYVCRLFPSPYVHIGGDECPSVRWKDCPKCQARIKAEGLKDEKDLQPWVTRRFVRFLESRGKRAVGWDEYLNGDVPKSCIGMYWRARKISGAGHDRITGVEAVEKGHDMVMAPSPETYFYFGQGLEDDPFEYGGNLQLPLAKVYAFNPCRGVPTNARKHVLGGQCCNWSEYTWNENDLEWKMWPRACAMAETLWLGDAKPSYDNFYARMRIHRQRLVRAGVNAAPLPPLPEFPEWSAPRAVTQGPHEHLLASYFAIDSWSPNKRYVLVLETDLNGRLPKAGERCTLGVVDLENGNRFVPVTTTACWNFQEGAMAFWMDDDTIIFNDIRDAKFRAVVMDWHKGKDIRVLPMPVSAVSEDRTWAVSINYARLSLTRPDYGYAGPGQDARSTVAYPEDDGVWAMDLKTGICKLVASIAATHPLESKVVWAKPTAKNQLAYHCHTVISKDGAKIFFLSRTVDLSGDNLKEVSYWETTALAVNRDGSNLCRCFPDGWQTSHFNWAPDGSHRMLATVIWDGDRKNRSWYGSAWSPVEFEVGKGQDEIHRIGAGILDLDWHCVYTPDGKFMSGETYWNKNFERPWVLVRLEDGLTMPMGSFFVPEKYRGGYWRCDLHARFRPDGKQVAFNSVHEGSRQVYVRDIKK